MTEKWIAPNSLAQELFLSSWCEEVGAFGMKGWGKSWAVLQELVYDINEPDFSAIVFRRTSTDFEDLWNKAIQHFKPLGGESSGTHHIITFPKGARIRFGHLQHAKDVLKYDGQEFQRIIFDELMQFPEFMYLTAMSWLRGPNPSIPKKIKATGNPIGEGKAFVKRRFFDTLTPFRISADGKQIEQGEIGWFTSLNGKDSRAPRHIEEELFALRISNPKDWETIKSKDKRLNSYMSRMWIFGDRSHNTTLMESDPGYEARLDQLPERERKAYKFGLFDSEDPSQQLIKTAHWERAISGNVPKVKGKKAFGFDYAGIGEDICCKTYGEGNQVKSIEEWESLTHSEAAKKLGQFIADNGKYQIKGAVDSVGEGSGVYTTACELGYAEQLDPLRYKDLTFKNSTVYQTTMQFDNLRSQMWFKFARAMEMGLIDLSYICSQAGLYENFAKLEEEILSMRAVQKGNVYKIIPKSELRKADISQEWGGGIGLRRSPDRADSLVYWWWIHDWEDYPIPESAHSHYRGYEETEPEPEASPWT